MPHGIAFKGLIGAYLLGAMAPSPSPTASHTLKVDSKQNPAINAVYSTETCSNGQNSILGETGSVAVRHGLECSNQLRCTSTKLMEIAKQKLAPKQFEKFERIYRSFFFFNPYQVLYQNSLKDIKTLSEPQQFNLRGEYPFDGYLAARKTLGDPPLDLDKMRKAHTAMLSAESVDRKHLPKYTSPQNSEGASSWDLGKLRDSDIVFRPFKKDYFHGNTDEYDLGLAQSPIRYQDVVRNHPYLTATEDSYYQDRMQIHYPDVRSATSLAKLSLEQIRNENLRARVEKARALLKEEAQLTNKSDLSDWKYQLSSFEQQGTSYQQETLVEDLIHYQIVKLNDALADRSITREKVIEATAKFYRNMVGIHTFKNGNGRTSRLIAEWILEKHGINPPLSIAWGQDVLLTEDGFIKMMKASIAVSDRFHEKACDGFRGLDSLDLAPFFNLPQKSVSLSDYLKWIRENRLELNIPSDALIWDEKIENILTPQLNLFREFQLHHRINPKHIRETEIDPFETWMEREKRLLQELGQPFDTSVTRSYAWLPLSTIEEYKRNGQKQEQSRLKRDIRRNVNFAGGGLYLSLNAYDSSHLSKPDGGLMVMKISGKEKHINVTDPAVLGRLYDEGIVEKELYYMDTGMAIRYSSQKSKEVPTHLLRQWMVYKSPMPAKAFSMASFRDFNLNELSRIKYRIPKDFTDAHREFDRIISDARDFYLKNLSKNQREKSWFWSVFGDCYKKDNQQAFHLTNAEECIQKLGVEYQHDSFTLKCTAVTPSKHAFIREEPKEVCRSKGIQLERPQKNLDSEFILPVGTGRTEEEQERLLRTHFRLHPKKSGKYQVLAQNHRLEFFLKEFDSKQEALDYLERVPHPFDLDRYIERAYRNRGEFEKSLEKIGKEFYYDPPTVMSDSAWSSNWYFTDRCINRSKFFLV